MTEWKSYVDLDGTHVLQAANSPTTVAELLEFRGLHRAQIVQNAEGTDHHLVAELLGEAWQLADFAARSELVPRIQTALSVLAQVRQALNGEIPAGTLAAVERILLGVQDRLGTTPR